MNGATVTTDLIRQELLQRAIALGDELMRLSDDLGYPIAGNHICQGVEVLREAVARIVH